MVGHGRGRGWSLSDEYAALIRAVVAAGSDTAPRLVLADWCRERDREVEAGFWERAAREVWCPRKNSYTSQGKRKWIFRWAASPNNRPHSLTPWEVIPARPLGEHRDYASVVVPIGPFALALDQRSPRRLGFRWAWTTSENAWTALAAAWVEAGETVEQPVEERDVVRRTD